jgi:PrtD family type I secretion system ABC transporter
MLDADRTIGQAEMRAARRESRGLLWSAGSFSIFINLLMLTGPLFMLQVYDRVLGSRSEETLVALFVLMGFLFLVMGVLDWARGRVLARMGARFQDRLDRRVFSAVLRKSSLTPETKAADNQLKDLESVQRFFSAPVFASLFDIPWTPLFLCAIALFHPWLGALAVAGGGILILITVANQLTTKSAVQQSTVASYKADRMAEHLHGEAENIRSLGMQRTSFERWHKSRSVSLKEGLHANDLGGSFSVATKTFRLFLQSAMLGLGAYLVLQGEMTPGGMIAGSIMLGRALAPVDTVVGQWGAVQRAKRGWESLVDLLSEVPEETTQTELPAPKARLEIQTLTVVPPGARQASLKMVSFELLPGQAVGVIGPSGSGKSTLARALTGVWSVAGGKIRLDGAAIDQYDPERLAQYIGYLPQRVHLFEGTIAENIARLSSKPDAAKVVEAAKKAAAHEMILKLPNGYDTQVAAAGGQLSGGQVQRIGLARAMYGEPVILVLDEPNSNLDNEGSEALNMAIRQMKEDGRSALIMAHRPAAIKECDMLLMLEDGGRRAWGPRDVVLSEVTKNHQKLQQTANKPTGVT